MIIVNVQKVIFGAATNLANFLVIMMVIRFMIMTINSSKANILNDLSKYIKTEFINICLIWASSIMDKILIEIGISWDWSIVFSITLLIIIDELSFIVTNSHNTTSSIFLMRLMEIIKKHINSKFN